MTTHRIPPPHLVGKPPAKGSDEAQAPLTHQADTQYLRKHIGGVWRFNAEKNTYYASFQATPGKMLVDFLKETHIKTTIGAPEYDQKKAENRVQLSISADQVRKLINSAIDYGDSNKSLADQFADQLQGGHRR